MTIQPREPSQERESSDKPVRLRAGCCVVDAETVLPCAEVTILGDRVLEVRGVPRAALTPAERSQVITPGLVNAHTHLDLGALRNTVSAGSSFTAWVSSLVEKRADLDGAAIDAGVARSAEEAIRTGTTSVIDIDSCGRTRAALLGTDSPLRSVILTEVLDGSPAGLVPRAKTALLGADEALLAGPSSRHWPGVSPHGTHTVGDALLAALGERRAEGGWPMATHWAETPEEIEWLLHGSGPFADWLGPSPQQTGTDRLRDAGLLERAILIHGNYPQPQEAAAIAAAGAAVIHCPGSHLFFGRDPFPFEAYERAGVVVALGTDSWASNDALDMRREMRLARERLGVSAQGAWRMATEVGASLLPWKPVDGRIRRGAAADLAVFQNEDVCEPEEVLEWLTLDEPPVREVWIGGQRTASQA